jgi:hypothetical protein
MVFGARRVKSVACRAGGTWVDMTYAAEANLWIARLTVRSEPLVDITVRAVDESGRPGEHRVSAAARSYIAAPRSRDGGDDASIGAWPENGIPGTKLGPNRNAKPLF